MVFSSLTFLCIFLPVTWGICRVIPSLRLQNAVLLAASLLFYAYGEPVYVLLMILSAVINYLLALAAEKRGRLVAAAAVCWNIGLLIVFKYAGFLASLAADLTGLPVPVPEITLPIGISFFTFQALSYVLDVVRGGTAPQKNFGRLLLYISFFPQLIAGPIVKYHDIEKELADRRITDEGTADGLQRMIRGLGAKVLIAGAMGQAADALYAARGAQLSSPVCWLGAVCYMLQIYFDFSGYSSMAIGLGEMFGFHFRENFRYPYAAVSMQDFWRRWHISLSGWFREYLYIPLGGSRKGRARAVRNKWIVFACTGIWHGANLTFLFWGLYHGFFLMLEELVPALREGGGRIAAALRRLYVLLVVLVGFVFFRADSLGDALLRLRYMFAGWTGGSSASAMRLLMAQLTPYMLCMMAAGVILALPHRRAGKFLAERVWLRMFLSLGLLALCLLSLAGGTYNPFIYFRF